MIKVAAWERALTEYPGSTRALAVIRIGLALLAWAEMGDFVTVRDAGLGVAALLYGSSAAMLIGYHAQVATFAAAVGLWITMNRVPATLHHHTYIQAVATTALALTPCGRSFSVDRWLAVRAARAANAPIPEERGNLWASRLIGLQLSALFFWGGYNKLTLGTQSVHTGFLRGDRLEQTLIYYYSLPAPFPDWLRVVVMALAASVTMFELFAGVGLWIPKARPYVLLGCFVMTSSFQLLLSVRSFGFLAALLYLVFVPTEKVHQIIDRLRGKDVAAALIRIGVALVAMAEIGEIIHPRKQYWLMAIPFLLSTFAMAFGVRARAASVAAAASIALVAWRADGVARDTYWLVAAAALVALSPCGNALSVDRYLAKAAPAATGSTKPLTAMLTALLFWNAYSQYRQGTTLGVALAVMMAAGGAALWHPKLRHAAVAPALIALAAAHFFLDVTALDLLLALALTLSVPSPTAVDAVFDDLVA